MKKGFLFGLGVFFAGSLLAASISTISIENKTAGDTVTNDEFNLITQGVGDVTATFDGVVSDETSIGFPKKLKSSEFCIGEDCIARWPEPTTPGTSITSKTCPSGQQLQSVSASGVFTCGADQIGSGGGSGVTAKTCPTGQLLKSVNSSGVFTCAVDQTGGSSSSGGVTDVCPGGEVMNGLNNGQIECVADQSGASGSADNLGNHTATATLTTKNIIPDGHLTRDIGSSSKWFKNLYVEDINMGGNTLRMNGADIMKNNNSVFEFNAPQNEMMQIKTIGTGEMKINSSANLNMEVISGADNKLLKIKNNSDGGDIEIATGTGSSHISLKSPVIKMGTNYPTTKIGINYSTSTTPAYDLDVNGDINFTGNLYQNGVIFSGGSGGISNQTCTSGKVVKGINNGVFSCAASSGSSPWTITQGIRTTDPDNIYTALANQRVGIGKSTPTEKLEVHGGNIKISKKNGNGGKLIAANSIIVGGEMCPAPGSECPISGEIANCGSTLYGAAIQVCDKAGGKWMPISSAQGTIVGYTTNSCDSDRKGTMRFAAGSTESLQICMKNSGSSTYSWRTIMSGGGTLIQ